VFELDQETGGPGAHLVESIVWGAGTTHHGCPPSDDVAEAAAGAWLLGTDDIRIDEYAPDPDFHAQVRDAVRQLRRLPAAEQTRRVTALRDAAAACQVNLLPILTTGKDHG
jgi:L-alanine-DL-glutamate epimerase-like enolase superfamily enzyme